jgi:leader peptidase (prepilin peptidase)/N-methyltransferase
MVESGDGRCHEHGIIGGSPLEPLPLALLLGGSGLLAGSFLGLLSLRLPAGEPVVRGRSRCGGCGRPLAPWQLVPLVSYALTRGRCADCGARIPPRYPLMEAACAGIGVWAALAGADPIHAALTALLGWQLLLVAVVDAEHFWLPDALTLPLLATGLAAAAWAARDVPVDALIGAAAGFGSLWLIARAYRAVRGRDGLGGGDPFLLAAGGAWVGWIGLPSVLIWAAAAGLSVALAMKVGGRAVDGDSRLPFGVFLAVGIWATWLIGPLGL